MQKYGLPLGVVAGLVLAAALGAVAGARWASRRAPSERPDVIAARESPTAARALSPRPLAPPRFLTPAAQESADGPPARPTRATTRAREAAAGPAGPRPEMGSEGPAPSPAALARAREVRAALETAVAAHPGTRVRFADCSTGTCVARVESADAAAIDRLLMDRQRLPPGFAARAHERLTAFNGRLWELELVEQR